MRDKTIWVTRPKAQAKSLCHLIEEQQGKAVRVPLLVIQAIDLDVLQQQRLRSLDSIDIIIFVSINAVKQSLRFLQPECVVSRSVLVIAIGPTTAACCQEMGFRGVIHTHADSENLLSVLALQEANVRGRQIAILRGCGGRTLLGDTLRERGAKVSYFELYERVCPQYSYEDQALLWSLQRPHIILITSAESLNNLKTMTFAAYQQDLMDTPLVVFSQRIAEYARRCGFQAPLIVCDEPNDQALLEACIKAINNDMIGKIDGK